MSKAEHKRRWDTASKLLIGVATISIGGMMAMQTNYDKKTADYMETLSTTASKNHDELIAVNLKLLYSNGEMDEIKGNQKALIKKVGSIEKKFIRTCERNKLYNNWPNHDGDCK